MLSLTQEPVFTPTIGMQQHPIGGWDPRTAGCRCDECPLGTLHRRQGTWRPVPPEVGDNATSIGVYAESPGSEEVIRGRPLIGPSGREMMLALKAQGVERRDVVLGNAIACQPPLNDLKRILHQLKKENTRRKARGETPLITPMEACKPLFLQMLNRTPNALLVGSTPFASLTGRKHPIRKVRGSLVTMHLEETPEGEFRPWKDEEGIVAALHGRKSTTMRVVPTLHPAFVLRSKEWRPVMWQDVGRFFRWIQGRLDWVPPKTLHHPSPDQIEHFLFHSGHTSFAVDIETGGERDRKTKKLLVDARDLNTCHLRCIGISTPEGGIVIPFRSVKGDVTLDGVGKPVEIPVDGAGKQWQWVTPTAYYTYADAQRIRQLVTRFLLDPRLFKMGHNVLQFDWPILKRVLALPVDPSPTFDTIFGFRSNHSDLSRDLYTLGTLYTDVPDWKASNDDRKIALDPRSDKELWDYCLVDCVVVSRVAPRLIDGASTRHQLPSLEIDHRIQQIGHGMRAQGLLVDQKIRQEMETEWSEKVVDARKKIRDVVGQGKFNPGSNVHLMKLFYDEWKLPILTTTDGGDPSVDDATLRKFILHNVLSDAQFEFVDALRSFREAMKVLGTYLIPLQRGRLVGADGRIHPKYNAYTPATGRISSSGPNAQNMPPHILKCLVPGPGNVFIGADYDQIELRLFSAMARIASYLKVFADKGDPHSVTAIALYGNTFQKELDIKIATGQQTQMFDALRRLAKVFIYAVLYGGTAKTIWESVSSAEDPKTGKLLFPGMELKAIRAIYDRFMRNLPEVSAWWETQWAFAKQWGCITEPILGRRRDFPEFERNEILNHPIQGGAAAIMSLGLIRLVDRFPFDPSLNTGVANQCHDAVVVEAREKDADRVRLLVEDSLTSSFDHLPGVSFTTKAKVGTSWYAVK